MKKRIAVAMSGGVDSSLVVALLKKEGYDVFGATMILEENSERAILDAKSVADEFGIEHYIFDFRKVFQKRVIEYFHSEYKRGHTPNPCVECNRYLKFGAFWEKVKELGAEMMATGHYVRLEHDADGHVVLFQGIDITKDQSYMLWPLNQSILANVIFPLGEYKKSEVRELAARYSISVVDKKESQDICFITDNYRDYLLREVPMLKKSGNIVDMEGNVLGTHEGIAFYTIGQRRGLGIAYREPLFVQELRANSNEVVVAGADSLYSKAFIAKDVNWIDGSTLTSTKRASVKVRYSKNTAFADILPLENGEVKVIFESKERAITKGQSAVFYDGERLLGGGIISALV